MKQDVLKFIKRFLLLLLLVSALFSPVFYFNFCIDPYGIFRSDFTKQRIEPNSHFIKLRHILFNRSAYDSFIFGNSRANNIDNLKIPGGRFFNLYYSLGIPKEHLKDLKEMLHRGVLIKNVLICLDFVSYSAGDWGRENDPLRKPYPDKNWELFKFYTNYIFQVPSKEFRTALMSTPPNSIYRNILVTGRAVNDSAELFIKTNTAAHLADPKFKSPSIIGYDDLVDQTIKDLREIKALCDDHKISLKLVVNPVHKVTYLGNNVAMHHRFLMQLAGVSEFYDFGGVNRITSNNYFYYEAAHFRPVIGDAMIDLVYRNKRIDTIPEFGVLVDKSTVAAHIAALVAGTRQEGGPQ